jgi:hypothetical protein
VLGIGLLARALGVLAQLAEQGATALVDEAAQLFCLVFGQRH